MSELGLKGGMKGIVGGSMRGGSLKGGAAEVVAALTGGAVEAAAPALVGGAVEAVAAAAAPELVGGAVEAAASPLQGGGLGSSLGQLTDSALKSVNELTKSLLKLPGMEVLGRYFDFPFLSLMGLLVLHFIMLLLVKWKIGRGWRQNHEKWDQLLKDLTTNFEIPVTRIAMNLFSATMLARGFKRYGISPQAFVGNISAGLFFIAFNAIFFNAPTAGATSLYQVKDLTGVALAAGASNQGTFSQLWSAWFYDVFQFAPSSLLGGLSYTRVSATASQASTARGVEDKLRLSYTPAFSATTSVLVGPGSVPLLALLIWGAGEL